MAVWQYGGVLSFCLKTINYEEGKLIRNFLKDYYLHLKQFPHTLLSKFFGLWKVQLGEFCRIPHHIHHIHYHIPHAHIQVLRSLGSAVE